MDQAGIAKGDLTPYVKLVRARIDKNPESAAWRRLDTLWGHLVDHARSTLAYYQQGRAGPRHERIAAHELIKLGDAVPAREAVVTVLAMQELEPRRFRSDAAFRMQVVRRVRGLTDVNAGEYFDHNSGRSKRVYRDLTPRAATLMGQWLAEVLGGAGIHLARLEQRDIKKNQLERQALREALADLK